MKKSLKIQLGQLVSARNALIKIGEDLKTNRIPIKIAYWIGKDINRVNEELQYLDQKRAELVQTYGKKGDAGNLIVSDTGEYEFETPEIQKEYFDKFVELLAIDVDIELYQFKLDDLDPYINLSPEEAVSIEFLFEDEVVKE